MNLSGIVVATNPAYTDEVVGSLNNINGVDVYHVDAASGRIVLVQEATTVDDEINGLKHIKSLPHVSLAEMVYHHFQDDESIPDLPEGDVPDIVPISDQVMQRLTNRPR